MKYFLLLFFFFISSSIAADILIADKSLPYPSNIKLEIIGNISDENVLVKTPDSDFYVAMNVEHNQQNSVIEYKPHMPGEYTFKLPNSKSQSIDIYQVPFLDVFIEGNMEVGESLTIGTKDSFDRLAYKWIIKFENNVVFESNNKSITFKPSITGTYDLILIAKDSLFTETKVYKKNTYRQFTIINSLNGIMPNIPNDLTLNSLPLPVSIITPNKNTYSIKWIVNEIQYDGDVLVLTNDMVMKDNKISINISISEKGKEITRFDKTLHLYTNYAGIEQLEVIQFPSLNYFVKGTGYLNLGGDLGRRIIKRTDDILILKPAFNVDYKIDLEVDNQVVATKEIANTLTELTFDFSVTNLSNSNVGPANIEMKLIYSNIPKELISQVFFWLNKERVPTYNGKGLAYSDTSGINTVRAIVELNDGRTLEKTHHITLSQVTKPDCELNYDHMQLEVWATCSDSDSVIDTYSYMDGLTNISKRSSLYISNDIIGKTLKFRAQDMYDQVYEVDFKIFNGSLHVVQK